MTCEKEEVFIVSDQKNRELIAVTKTFLNYVDVNKTELQKDNFLFSSFMEVCKVLESSITVIEVKIEHREKRKSTF